MLLRFHCQLPREKDTDVEKRTPPYWTGSTIRQPQDLRRRWGTLSSQVKRRGDGTREEATQLADCRAEPRVRQGKEPLIPHEGTEGILQMQTYIGTSVTLQWFLLFSLLALAIPLDLFQLHSL